jgi:hypothetical protein
MNSDRANQQVVAYLVIIIIFHHELRPGWPVSVSAVISSSSLLSGRPGRRLPSDDNP